MHKHFGIIENFEKDRIPIHLALNLLRTDVIMRGKYSPLPLLNNVPEAYPKSNLGKRGSWKILSETMDQESNLLSHKFLHQTRLHSYR